MRDGAVENAGEKEIFWQQFGNHVIIWLIKKQETDMEGQERLEAFEKMLQAVKENYKTADSKMKQLKAEGKEKTATYRQLMGNKLQYQNMLSLYEIYGLLKEEE